MSMGRHAVIVPSLALFYVRKEPILFWCSVIPNSYCGVLMLWKKTYLANTTLCGLEGEKEGRREDLGYVLYSSVNYVYSYMGLWALPVLLFVGKEG